MTLVYVVYIMENVCAREGNRRDDADKDTRSKDRLLWNVEEEIGLRVVSLFLSADAASGNGRSASQTIHFKRNNSISVYWSSHVCFLLTSAVFDFVSPCYVVAVSTVVSGLFCRLARKQSKENIEKLNKASKQENNRRQAGITVTSTNIKIVHISVRNSGWYNLYTFWKVILIQEN